MSTKQTKGFTLIELIITVSILAVLIAAIVVALNPAEQLKRSRDAKRVADLDAMKTAINLYLAQATTTINLSGDTTANNRCSGGAGVATIFANTGAASSSLNSNGLIAPMSVFVTSTAQAVATSSAAQVDRASTWMPAVLGQTPGGAPLAQLPLDPTNGTGANANFYYAYACKTTNAYEFTARLESTYFTNDLDLDGTDGGNSSSTYEVGTDETIVPPGY